MYIEKIEIPAFRVLRDVTLEFGAAYNPQIFPLGSENGGGKSTLLQLLFALLHCSTEPERLPYLTNLLSSDFSASNEEQRIIARLTIKLDQESHALEFVSLGDRFLEKNLQDQPTWGFRTESIHSGLSSSLPVLEDRLERHKRLEERFSGEAAGKEVRVSEIMEVLGREVARVQLPRDVRELRAYLGPTIKNTQQEIDATKTFLDKSSAEIDQIQGILIAHNFKYITSYTCSTPDLDEPRALICRAHGQSASKTEDLLRAVASKVFLLGPSNQQYLFLGRDTRKALLGANPPRSRAATSGEAKRQRPQIEYLVKLAEAEGAMTGFYAYDWLSVKPLVRLFESARNEDFQSVVKTGSYGNSYTRLMSEVNGLLRGKKVRPLGDLSGVEFVVTTADGQETSLSPEDLSQGELKRLMIYAWLRANHAVDALVLIDEIEASFHPDWQVGIVRDLQEWAPKNQYVLATHSFELCQALTPRHVRELAPRLARGAGASDPTGEPGSSHG